MVLIASDPSLLRCPDYSTLRHERSRNALLADANLPEVNTDALAAAFLAGTWAEDNAADSVVWDAQIQQGLHEDEARRATEREERHAALIEEQRLEEEALAAVQRRRGTLHAIPEDSRAPDHIETTISSSTEAKMNSRERVFLWNFLQVARLEASLTRQAGVEKTFTISSDGTTEGLTFKPSSNGPVSPNAVPDSSLTLEQILEAKIGFIAAMIRTGWGNYHVKMFTLFFTQLEMDPTRYRPNGHEIIALYVHKSLNDWYIKNTAGTPYNISAISAIHLAECAAEVNAKQMAAEITRSRIEIAKVSTPSKSLRKPLTINPFTYFPCSVPLLSPPSPRSPPSRVHHVIPTSTV
jgi:hypothetical protein